MVPSNEPDDNFFAADSDADATPATDPKPSSAKQLLGSRKSAAKQPTKRQSSGPMPAKSEATASKRPSKRAKQQPEGASDGTVHATEATEPGSSDQNVDALGSKEALLDEPAPKIDDPSSGQEDPAPNAGSDTNMEAVEEPGAVPAADEDDDSGSRQKQGGKRPRTPKEPASDTPEGVQRPCIQTYEFC